MATLKKEYRQAAAEIISIIDDLPLEAYKGTAFAAIVETRLKQRQREYFDSEQRKKDEQRQIKEGEKRQEEKQKHDKKVVDWVSKNVRVGDIVKMSGCRDGHGIRRVSKIEWNPDRSVKRLICLAFEKTRTTVDFGHIPELVVKRPKFTVVFYERNQLTEHLPNKIVSILIDGEMIRVNDKLKGK